MTLCMAEGHAQNINGKEAQDAFDEFRKAVTEEFESFRQQYMDDFVEFMRNPWKEFEETKPVPKPKDEPVPPVVMPEEDKDKPIKDKPVVIDEVVKPAPIEPQPKPVEPIDEVPVVEEKTVGVTFYGSELKVRFDIDYKIRLSSTDRNSIADAIGKLQPENYDNLLFDCLKLRSELNLSDWAYMQLLEKIAEKIQGKDSNESALLMAYLYVQSGYKMRLASDGSKIYMLYASKHIIFNQPSFDVDGEKFYGVKKLPTRLFICEAAFPKEKSMSLFIPKIQHFASKPSETRTIVSKKYPDVKMSVSVNQNLMAFYNTYPTSMVDDNFMTRWAMYANTPMDNYVSTQLYQALRDKLKGLTQLEAVNVLLNWVQTGFVYEYDDKVWGGDRAFFAEESLYYPYCDCEDRSILFTRLVRDLLGLDCILIYYPGHLASAVEFKQGDVAGDYILLNGRKYIVADATYINAPVGRTMPDMDNKTAKVILLNKQ